MTTSEPFKGPSLSNIFVNNYIQNYSIRVPGSGAQYLPPETQSAFLTFHSCCWQGAQYQVT